MSWGAIAVGIIGTGTSLIVGAQQRKKARRELASLNAHQPKESIPQEVLQNQELASLRSNTGLPSEQYNQAMKNILHQQSRTLRSANDRKLGLSLLPSIDYNAENAIGNLDVANAKARQGNEKVLMDVNNQVGNWKKGIYDRNVRQPWNRDYEYNMGLLGSGDDNLVRGINSGANALGAGITAAYNSRKGRGSRGLIGGSGSISGNYGVGGDPNGGNLHLDEYGNLIS